MIARMLVASRFPRAAAVIEILAIAELCRCTTRALEALAENAGTCEPASLRRAAHALVRSLHAELQGQVSL